MDKVALRVFCRPRLPAKFILTGGERDGVAGGKAGILAIICFGFANAATTRRALYFLLQIRTALKIQSPTRSLLFHVN